MSEEVEILERIAQGEKPLGIKHDEGKLDWSLLPFAELDDVIRALMHGEKEYGTDNWKHVKPKKRYLKAAYRHMSRWMQGERFDIGPKGSNLPHLAHAVCCLMFAMWHDTEDAK